jgi:ribosome modulation factor
MRARLGTMALLIGLGIATFGVSGAKAQEGPPPPGYYNQPWTRVPDDYRSDMARRGYHDGIEGARKDFENHRQPNVNNREEYRHPDVPHGARHEYREAFQRGYQRGVENIYQGRRDHDDRH